MSKPIRKLTLEGFKSIRSLRDFPLNDLNILIGANGAGKSNFVEFFKLLSLMMTEDALPQYIRENGDAYFFGGPKRTSSINVKLVFGEGASGRYEAQSVKNGYGFTWRPTENGGLAIDDEVAYFFNESANEFPIRLGAGGRNAKLSTSDESVAKYTYDAISSWRIFHFHDTSDLAGFWRFQDMDNNEVLSRDGANIAPFLRKLKKEHRSHFDTIVRTVRLVLPFFHEFILKPNSDDNLKLFWRQKGLADVKMRPTQLSDGAIRFICLATALLQPNLPTTIIIDEPELGLHPYAIEILAELIQSASMKTQIIVSTQSPSLLDCFEPEDVIVVDRVKGASEFSRLNESELSDWLEEYSLGELWKKNVLLGGPSYE